MLNFTKQERAVLLSLAAILLLGSSMNYAFKKYPRLNNMVNVMDSERIYSKVNINTASEDELVRIPYIGVYTAKKFIEYRQENGPFKSIEEVKIIKGIREKNFKKFKNFLKI